jgi:predicted SAM-dependent methyltransferase/protein-tyrosine-phosphatase
VTAEFCLKHYLNKNRIADVTVCSAGLKSTSDLSGYSDVHFERMKELDIDTSTFKRLQFEESFLEAYDFIVAMGMEHREYILKQYGKKVLLFNEISKMEESSIVVPPPDKDGHYLAEIRKMVDAIYHAMPEFVKKLSGAKKEVNTYMKDNIRVVIGAGEYNNNPGWIHTQENELNLLDLRTWRGKFDENSVTAVLAEHVWEHLTYEEGVTAAKMIYPFLRTQGYIRCAVPDGYFRDANYQKLVQVGGPGTADHAAASHQIVHNFHTLTALFEEAGYDVHLLEYCDEEGSFHFLDWKGEEGIIFRSKKYDPRNQDELVFPSLIVDAIKQ